MVENEEGRNKICDLMFDLLSDRDTETMTCRVVITTECTLVEVGGRRGYHKFCFNGGQRNYRLFFREPRHRSITK